VNTTINTRDQVDAAERVLRLAWLIVAGAVIFSVITVTPLVERVTPDRWDRTAPLLPIVVDAAVVIVVRIDEIIARLGGRPGGWSAGLRWLTGGLTLALNVADSALKRDFVGVGVHMVAPVLLIVTAEATLTYRRAIMSAVAEIDREQAVAHERSRVAHEERIERERADRAAERERADRERERVERVAREEREHAAHVAREDREHAAKIARDQYEYEVRAAREETERAAAAERDRVREEEAAVHRERARIMREQEADMARRRAERERAEAADRADREEAAEAARVLHERLVSAREHGAVDGDQVSQDDAMMLVGMGLTAGATQRQMSIASGWSVGWIAARCKEFAENRAA